MLLELDVYVTRDGGTNDVLQETINEDDILEIVRERMKNKLQNVEVNTLIVTNIFV